MRNLWGLIMLIPLFVSSCGVEQSKYDEIVAKNEELKKEIASIKEQSSKDLKIVRDSLKMLKFPADQRYNQALKEYEEGKYDLALATIKELTKIFPYAKEAENAQKLVASIEEKKEAARKEEERIKALGFKAIKQQTSFKIDYNTVNISNINIAKTFTFDDHGREYYYRTADRGNKYVSAAMSITSTNNDPDLPQFAIYKISGSSMNLVGRFSTEFARWKDYGAYLGNYHDNSNDFSKVSTVRFKIGIEISEDITAKQPFAIVVKKENRLSRDYERFNNPPVSYKGTVNYPTSLKVEDFNNNYILVKLFNLK